MCASHCIDWLERHFMSCSQLSYSQGGIWLEWVMCDSSPVNVHQWTDGRWGLGVGDALVNVGHFYRAGHMDSRVFHDLEKCISHPSVLYHLFIDHIKSWVTLVLVVDDIRVVGSHGGFQTCLKSSTTSLLSSTTRPRIIHDLHNLCASAKWLEDDLCSFSSYG